MIKEIFSFLRSYSFDPIKVDRLIVSAFLYSNDLLNIKNQLIKSLLIIDNDDDFEHLQNFLKTTGVIEIEDLIEIFEFVVSPAEKIVSGAVYTPKFIREYIVENSIKQRADIESIIVCDPACGCAGFLYTAAKKIKELTGHLYKDIFRNNLYGLDIQGFSVNRSKYLLSLVALINGEDSEVFEFNICLGNSLNFQWNKVISNFIGFDIVIGNPPYVCSRNIDQETKTLLEAWKVCSTGHPDLYIPFFEIGLSNLKINGLLGFITMNTFFKSVNGRALRQYFQEESHVFKIVDFAGNQVFSSKSTYTCICLIKKSFSPNIEYLKLSSIELLYNNSLEYNIIPYRALDYLNGWNLQEIEILAQIERTGTSLSKVFRSRNGIATLRNNIYIFTPINEDDDYYYFQSDSIYKIEKAVCKDIINSNRFTKESSIEAILEKIIFPYFYNDKGSAVVYSEEVFISQFPHAYNYLCNQCEILSQRDNGKGKYKEWFAYGRNQSLDRYTFKLFFPHIASSIPNYVINSDENLLFYNGLAFVGDNVRDLKFLGKLMSTNLFWFYITNSSKSYGSNFYSLSKNYIKNFGIYNFTDDEINYIISENDFSLLNVFVESKYNIDINRTREIDSLELLMENS